MAAASASDFVQEWFTHPEWWFAGEAHDAHITATFGHLLDAATNLEGLQGVLVYDQLPRHVYRKEHAAHIIEHFLQKALCISRAIWQDPVFNAVEWTFIMLPFRHTRDYSTILWVMQETWNKITASCDVYKRFLKATYDHAPIEYQTDLIHSPTTINGIEDTSVLAFWSPDAPKTPQQCMGTYDIRVAKDGVLVSLSGGVDSMLALYELAHVLKGTTTHLAAVHINYNNRPKECASEVAFLARWCATLKIPLYVRTIAEISRKPCMEMGLREVYEEYTRNVRMATYKCVWRDLMQLQGTPVIVLGHNLDDCLENIFTNMAHQNRYDNLNGMDVISMQYGIRFWRPLLNCSKGDIINAARSMHVPFFHNSTPTWSQRGQIRNSIVPTLLKWHPQSIVGVYNWALTTRELYKVMHDSAKVVVRGWDPKTGLHLPIPEVSTSAILWQHVLTSKATTMCDMQHLCISKKAVDTWIARIHKLVDEWTHRKSYTVHLQKVMLNKRVMLTYQRRGPDEVVIHLCFHDSATKQ
jgi:tRNA(Ile)-lysidine synthetase-like protein